VTGLSMDSIVQIDKKPAEAKPVDSTSATLAKAMLSIVIMAEHVNRVVAECNTLKTGCSTYEAFPNIASEDNPSQISDKMTHLMVAAIEGNLRKASAYIAGADMLYKPHAIPLCIFVTSCSGTCFASTTTRLAATWAISSTRRAPSTSRSSAAIRTLPTPL